nr:MAG TPA: hypothetical protein [Caudoviricetes sp.]
MMKFFYLLLGVCMANECIRVTRVSMRNVVEDTNDE